MNPFSPLQNAIVAIDSNVGLLALHRALCEHGLTIPNLVYLPLRDRGTIGASSRHALEVEVQDILVQLSYSEAKGYLLVCNTISALFFEKRFRLLGTIDFTIHALVEAAWPRQGPVLVLGSQLLGDCGVYTSRLAAYGCPVIFHATPDIISDIAWGRTSGIADRLAAIINSYPTPIAAVGLCCTHYSGFAKELRSLVKPPIVDSGAQFGNHLQASNWLQPFLAPRQNDAPESMTIILRDGQSQESFSTLIHHFEPTVSLQFISPAGIALPPLRALSLQENGSTNCPSEVAPVFQHCPLGRLWTNRRQPKVDIENSNLTTN